MIQSIGVYIHIPFCKRLCYYCHFCKYPYTRPSADAYIPSLLKEIQIRSHLKSRVDTIYMGGGSPSLLNQQDIMRIIETLRDHFNLSQHPEFTIELNPEDISKKKIEFYKGVGINRLSIGVQSFAKKDLLYLQRNHDAKQALRAVETALNSGFENVNIDLIIGIPGQTPKDIRTNHCFLEKFPVQHVSSYILEGVEKGSETENRDHDLYFVNSQALQDLGYIQYEVSNSAKKGFLSKHNLKYWQNENYIGLGASASSYENQIDSKNNDNLVTYSKKIANHQLPVETTKKIDPKLRKIITGLRLLEGIPAENFQAFPNELDDLINNQLLIKSQSHVKVNPQKILLLNEILQYFI